MEWLKNPLNVLTLVLGSLAALGMILVAIQKGLKLKVSKEGISAEDAPEAIAAPAAPTQPCDAYQHEHMTILTELRDSLARIEAKIEAQSITLSAQDEILGSIVSSEKLSLKKIMEDRGQLAPGEEINGDLRDAYVDVKKAEELYKSMRKVGGGA
jgi:hypothetical protein